MPTNAEKLQSLLLSNAFLFIVSIIALVVGSLALARNEDESFAIYGNPEHPSCTIL